MRKFLFLFFISLSFSIFSQDLAEREIMMMMVKQGYKLKTSQYGQLKEGESMFRNFQFAPENEYIIVAYGEGGVLDTDIVILGKQNEELAKDGDTQPLATAKFSSNSPEYLKVIISNYNSEVRNHAYIIKYMLFYKVKEG